MNRKAVKVAVIGAVLLFVVAFFASPLLAVRGLIDAAERGDEAKLERLVDFPAFRQSLKEELNARLVAEMRADLGGRASGLSGLGLLLAPALIGGAVDAFVTPPAVAAMVRTAEVPNARDVVRDRAPTAPEEAKGKVRRGYRYSDMNTFVVRLTRDDEPGEYLDLQLQRRGLFSWKLAGLDLSDPA